MRRNSCFRGWIAEAWQAPRLETEQSGEHFLLLIQIRPPCCSSAVKVKARTFAQREPRHVLYLDGGAYCFGSPSYYRMFMYRIAVATSAQVLCVKYRLAPEHPFPSALDDPANAYRWPLDGGAEPSRIAVIGDSAGGGLAFATLLKLRDNGLALPAAAVALSPWTDLALTGASHRVNASADPLLNADQAPVFARWYLASADPRNPYASPLYGDLTGLPPTLIQGATRFCATTQCEWVIGCVMRDAGCAVEVEIWPRMPHVWQVFGAILPEARRAVERIGAFMQGTLGGGQRAVNHVGLGGPPTPQRHQQTVFAHRKPGPQRHS